MTTGSYTRVHLDSPAFTIFHAHTTLFGCSGLSNNCGLSTQCARGAALNYDPENIIAAFVGTKLPYSMNRLTSSRTVLCRQYPYLDRKLHFCNSFPYVDFQQLRTLVDSPQPLHNHPSFRTHRCSKSGRCKHWPYLDHQTVTPTPQLTPYRPSLCLYTTHALAPRTLVIKYQIQS